jgi:hypothetical protein
VIDSDCFFSYNLSVSSYNSSYVGGFAAYGGGGHGGSWGCGYVGAGVGGGENDDDGGKDGEGLGGDSLIYDLNLVNIKLMILWILNINNLTNLNGFKCIEKINITIELNIVRIVIKRKFENLIYSKEINLMFSCVFLKKIL